MLELVRRDDAELAVTTPAVLPQQPHPGVEHAVDPAGERGLGDQRGVHHDLVPGAPSLHSGADALHHPGDVVARDVRERRRFRQPGRQPQVHVVQRRGPHRHAHLAGSGFGSGYLPPDVLAGRFRQVPCIHAPRVSRAPALASRNATIRRRRSARPARSGPRAWSCARCARRPATRAAGTPGRSRGRVAAPGLSRNPGCGTWVPERARRRPARRCAAGSAPSVTSRRPSSGWPRGERSSPSTNSAFMIATVRPVNHRGPPVLALRCSDATTCATATSSPASVRTTATSTGNRIAAGPRSSPGPWRGDPSVRCRSPPTSPSSMSAPDAPSSSIRPARWRAADRSSVEDRGVGRQRSRRSPGLALADRHPNAPVPRIAPRASESAARRALARVFGSAARSPSWRSRSIRVRTLRTKSPPVRSSSSTTWRC